MTLIEQLEKALQAEESIFRAQLIKEDLARLKALERLAEAAESKEAFLKQGLFIGWTSGDARTFELKPALEPLLIAFHAAREEDDEGAHARLAAAWQAFDAFRMERLVGCLSRVPRPDDRN